MKWTAKAKDLLQQYKHIWVLGYAFIYMPWFLYLEKHVTSGYYVIHSVVDDWIPFVEFFIVPYVLWFLFIGAVILYFFFMDVKGFYKLTKLMFTGMTIFLIISTLWPNGLDLRPMVFERDNVFVDMVRFLYRSDTPTNVLPSLHVFNSLAACIAIYHSEALRKYSKLCNLSYVLAGSIILATMFLKQHSIVDVMAAFVMAYALHQWVYVTEAQRLARRAGRLALQSK